MSVDEAVASSGLRLQRRVFCFAAALDASVARSAERAAEFIWKNASCALHNEFKLAIMITITN